MASKKSIKNAIYNEQDNNSTIGVVFYVGDPNVSKSFLVNREFVKNNCLVENDQYTSSIKFNFSDDQISKLADAINTQVNTILSEKLAKANSILDTFTYEYFMDNSSEEYIKLPMTYATINPIKPAVFSEYLKTGKLPEDLTALLTAPEFETAYSYFRVSKNGNLVSRDQFNSIVDDIRKNLGSPVKFNIADTGYRVVSYSDYEEIISHITFESLQNAFNNFRFRFFTLPVNKSLFSNNECSYMEMVSSDSRFGALTSEKYDETTYGELLSTVLPSELA